MNKRLLGAVLFFIGGVAQYVCGLHINAVHNNSTAGVSIRAQGKVVEIRPGKSVVLNTQLPEEINADEASKFTISTFVKLPAVSHAESQGRFAREPFKELAKRIDNRRFVPIAYRSYSVFACKCQHEDIAHLVIVCMDEKHEAKAMEIIDEDASTDLVIGNGSDAPFQPLVSLVPAGEFKHVEDKIVCLRRMVDAVYPASCKCGCQCSSDYFVSRSSRAETRS